MIRAIAAVDNKLGIADDKGIPWDLPADKKYFRSHTAADIVLMGYKVYEEFEKPLDGRKNYVVVRPNTKLRNGFLAVNDIGDFFSSHQSENVWIIGGASIYARTIEYVNELYITQILSDFHCTKFFPDFQNQFSLLSRSATQTQGNIDFCFEVWIRRQ